MSDILVAMDRDGTLNDDPGYFGKEDDWKEMLRFKPTVFDGLRRLAASGAKTAVITNQAGIARGFFGPERTEEIHREMKRILEMEGITLDSWQYAPYVDKSYAKKNGLGKSRWVLDDGDPRLTLRKPGAGMITEACKEMGKELRDFKRIFVIGDKIEDCLAGINAGGEGLLVGSGRSAREVIGGLPRGKLSFFRTFGEAVDYILGVNAKKLVKPGGLK